MKVKLLALSSLIALSACSEEHSDLQSWMQEQRNSAKSQIKPAEKPVPMEHVVYVTPQLSSPHAFSSSKMRSAAQNANAPDMSRAKELLENYSLENLKFVGSIGTPNNRSGLVEVDGHIYTVRVGNHIGQNYGRISKITADGLEIIEVVEDTDGRWVNRPTTLSAYSTNTGNKK
ncbi:pilus assembly protein PilP [Neisseriaceae bacterium B1]